MELKQKLFGTNAEMKNFAEEMDDRACEEIKARYIAQGIIKPSAQKYGPRERPHMSDEAHRKLRQKWIDEGFLQPRGTINDAFQKRGAAAQVQGNVGPGKNYPKDLRRDGGGHALQAAGTVVYTGQEPQAIRPGPRPKLH